MITEKLLAAMADRSAPWRVRPVRVDGTSHELLVLDLNSDALPAGVTGTNVLAVGQVGNSQITIVGDDPNVDLKLPTIPTEDLLG